MALAKMITSLENKKKAETIEEHLIKILLKAFFLEKEKLVSLVG